MNSYAISSCLLEKAQDDKRIITNVLHKFSDDTNALRVVVDKKGKIIDIYNEIANQNNIHVASWIKLLTRDPKQIETIDIDIDLTKDRIYGFLDIASKIRNEKNLIVFSHNNIPADIPYKENNFVNYNGTPIKVLNSGEAITELNLINNLISKTKQDMPTININNNGNDKGSKIGVKEIVYIVVTILALFTGGLLYKKYPFVGQASKECPTITITGEIDVKNQEKIKSVSIEEQTYAEDNTIVNGKFEFRQVAPISSTQITLIVKYSNGTKDQRIVVPMRIKQLDENCLLDIGRVR